MNSFFWSHILWCSHNSQWKWKLWFGSFVQSCGCAGCLWLGWHVQCTSVLTVVPTRIYKEVFVYQKFLGGRHGFHSNKTCNDTQSQISFYENSLKGPAYSKTHQEMCVWVRKSNRCCFVWRHRRGEMGTSLNVKGSQENVACVTSSSLSHWESSCGDSTSRRFQAVKGDRTLTMAVCHCAGLWALLGISQLSPGSLFSLAFLPRAVRENSCTQLAWCLGDMWDGHMGGQRTAKGQVCPVLPGARALAQGLCGLFHRAEVKWGKCIILCNSQRAWMGCRWGAAPSAGTVCQTRTCSGPRRPCIAQHLGLHSKVK